jgi:hypothetical protein
MSNSFERYAAMNTPSKRQRRVRVVQSEDSAPMVPTKLEKEQRDNTVQFQRYKKAVRAESEALLNSQHGANYRILLAILKRMTPQSSRELIDYVKGARWIAQCDQDQKFTVLSVIDMAIIRLRIRDGRAPFDDPLPDEPDSAFVVIRRIINGQGV